MKRLGKFAAAAAMAMAAAFVNGCGGGGGGGGTVTAVDTTRPVVVYSTPANNAPGIGTNSKVTVTFSEAMDPASVTQGSFLLIDTTTNPPAPVSATVVTYDQSNRIATLTAPPLEGSHLYSAKITTNVKDQAGNSMAADYTWTFTTAAGADVTPPVVTSRSPADGATGIAITSSVAISFSKPMDVSSVGNAFSLKETATNSTVAGAFSYAGGVGIFTPSTDLKAGTNYSATLTTAATDLTGTPLSSGASWNFTTGAGADVTPPTVASVTPASGATNVPTTTSISAVFNEPIDPEVFGSINGIATTVVVDYATNTVTMTPTVPLRPTSAYTFRLQVKDLSGNLMTSPHEWTFATGS